MPRDLHSILRRFGVSLLLANVGWLGAATDQAARWTPAILSTDQYESSPMFSSDGRTLIFMRSTPAFGDYRILQAQREHGAWTAPTLMAFTLPLPVMDADPCLSPDGRRLYFVSNRTPDGKSKEDLDIWFVARGTDGTWSAPQRLPEPVNSPGSELLPRILADGRIVFGSDRAGGLGQSDIYVATPQPGGGWTVENFGAPVSTAANEYEADISQDGKTLVVVADRGDRSHLYRFALQSDGRWRELGRIPAKTDVFQVGPLLSPKADRLLFAQVDGERSGELFLIDLSPHPDLSWPAGHDPGK